MRATIALALALVACGKSSPSPSKAIDAGVARPGPRPTPKVAPPLPLAAPPADAESLTNLAEAPAAVVRIKRLVAGNGPHPGRNDTVTINLDGWRPNGDTFESNRNRHRPVQWSLAMLVPGFAAAVATMQKGERAMIWVPAELNYRDQPTGPAEASIYQVELIDFEAAPATPPDVGAIPAGAKTSPSGLASEVVTAGTGKVHPRDYDGVTFHYTGWSSTGRIFDSSELRKRPKSSPMYREWPGIEEALSTMVVGERKRIWLPRGVKTAGGDPLVEEQPGLPAGMLCLELSLVAIQPGHPIPAAPPDVAAPPADALTSPQGVRYKVLKAGTGTVHPGNDDIVEVDYTGWSASGRPFDSTAIRGKPLKLVVSRALTGWTDGIKTMVEGETARLWVPESLAFKGEPGHPRGTVVFDMTLRQIIGPAPPLPARAQPPLGFGGQPPAGSATGSATGSAAGSSTGSGSGPTVPIFRESP